jgi:hypothetical protein
MDTLPTGFQLLEESAPDARAETLRKSLSLLVARAAHSSSGAGEPAANFVALLRQQAVELYMKQLETTEVSDSMDDPVMILLEKAQFLSSVRQNSPAVT